MAPPAISLVRGLDSKIAALSRWSGDLGAD
jgi:hypothetical protein